MQQSNIREINWKELKEVNSELSFLYGNRNIIVSGSCEESQNGKKRYHIVFSDENGYKSMTMLQKIAKQVKEKWKADEVFYYGVKVA